MSGVTGALASRAAAKQAEGLMAPLLSDDESSEGDDDSSKTFEPEKQTPLQKLKTAAAYLVIGAGVAASAASFYFAPNILMYVAGGVCIANAPFAAYKERHLSKIPTLRSMNNALREDANQLEEEVDQLSEEIDALEPEADRAKEVEEELRGIADKQQVNVNKLVDLVKENELILIQMRENLRQRIVQDVINIVVQSDRDNDQSIDQKEAKTLALKIHLQLQEYGVEFDSEKFFRVIGANPTVTSVIAIVQKLMPSQEVKKDGDESSSSDGEEEDQGEEDDDYDMFFVKEDTSAGGGGGQRRVSIMGSRSSLSISSLSLSNVKRKSSRKF